MVATRDGGHDKDGFPFQRPIAGRVYRITGIYEERYGLGCTLQDMDPFPYKGYFLFRTGKGQLSGWYFKKMEAADADFSEAIRAIYRRALPVSGEGVPSARPQRAKPRRA